MRRQSPIFLNAKERAEAKSIKLPSGEAIKRTPLTRASALRLIGSRLIRLSKIEDYLGKPRYTSVQGGSSDYAAAKAQGEIWREIQKERKILNDLRKKLEKPKS